MKRTEALKGIGRFFLTAAVLVLTALVFWFLSLPIREYEPKPNQIESVTASENITQDGIAQSMQAKTELKGIRVRWATHKTVPQNPIYADLSRLGEDEVLERLEIPASAIRDNEEFDIVFSGVYPPGDYLVELSASPESEEPVAVWESAIDTYREGSAFDSWRDEEYRDWSFSLLRAYPASMLIRHRIGQIIGRVLALLTGAAALCWIYAADRLKKIPWLGSLIRLVKRRADLILIGLLVLIPTCAYLDFLTGDRLYVFTMLDRGADSVAQTYPNLLNLAARIQKGQWGELFNFQQGLGDKQAAFFPTLTTWVSLFGESHVAYLMGVSQWAKVVFSGIFAYLFVKEYGAGAAARFTLALGYCFNSMLIARGAWESYPNVALLLMLWMYAYERRLNGKGLLLYLFSVLFLFVNLVLYDCLFYGVLIPCYMLIRRIVKEPTKRDIFRAFFLDFALFAAFALPGMLDTLRYQLGRTLSSSRLMEGMESYSETAGSFFSDAGLWLDAFLRTAGHSISGIINQSGELNLLEGPAFYTGIAALVAAPACLCCLRGKKRWVYLFLTVCAVCYMAIAPLRLIANGFAKETFKLSSFWITLLLFLLAAEYFRMLDQKEMPRRAAILTVVSAAAAVTLLLVAKSQGAVVSENEWIVSLVFVILYPILLVFRMAGRRAGFVRFLLVFCVAAEAVLTPYEMIHDRNMELAADNSWIERSETREIIASLPEDDWYRVEKDYLNVFVSDSLAEGYKGSASYVGGIEINQSVQDIYQAFGLPRREKHYLYGSGGNVYFESTAAVRYLLAPNDMAYRYGYEFIEDWGDIKLFENMYAHPLFYTAPEKPSPDSLKADFDLSSYRLGYEKTGTVYLFGYFPENSMLILQANIDMNALGTLYMQDQDGKISSANFLACPQTRIEIANDGLYTLWFDRNTEKRLKDISFYLADQDTYYQTYRKKSEDARQHAAEFRMCGENRFTGTVKADQDGYFITAIPYDQKWKVILDGEEQPTTVVNAGFLGAGIRAGEHEMEVFYDGDSWIGGNAFKILGFGAFLLAAVVVQYIKARKKEQ